MRLFLFAGVAQLGSAADLFIRLTQKYMEELQSKQKGNLTELQCITAFYELGYSVSIPYGENSRYDLIADIEGKLIKIQVKTSSIKNGNAEAIEFSCRSSRINSTGTINTRYTKSEIDYFATYWDN